MGTTASPNIEATRGAGAWRGLRPGLWQNEINVRDLIQQNYQPYDGDESFLAPATARTQRIWTQLQALFVEERRKGVLEVSQVPSAITAHAPGYIDREHELIFGLQTEAPLRRAIMPNGGLRMVVSALKAYGYEPDAHVVETFTKHRKTHNDGVFDAYTPDVLGPAPEPNLTIWYARRCRTGSGALPRRSRSTRARCSSKTTKSCAVPGATTARSPAACRRC